MLHKAIIITCWVYENLWSMICIYSFDIWYNSHLVFFINMFSRYGIDFVCTVTTFSSIFTSDWIVLTTQSNSIIHSKSWKMPSLCFVSIHVAQCIQQVFYQGTVELTCKWGLLGTSCVNFVSSQSQLFFENKCTWNLLCRAQVTKIILSSTISLIF